MRSRLLRMLLAVATAGPVGASCWSDRPPPPTTPSPPITSIASIERPAQRWPASTAAGLRPRTVDRCAQVVGHMFDLARQEGMNSTFTAAMIDEFQESTVVGCHETDWTEESLDCYAETTSTSQMGDCYRSMTPEQREDFERRFMDVRLKHRGSPTPTPQPPAP
jgi:hypothetical protein